MSIRIYKAYTPGTRNRALSAFETITKSTPEKKLTVSNHRKKGRNNRGVITIRHRGGGHKKLYRIIDFILACRPWSRKETYLGPTAQTLCCSTCSPDPLPRHQCHLPFTP